MAFHQKYQNNSIPMLYLMSLIVLISIKNIKIILNLVKQINYFKLIVINLNG